MDAILKFAKELLPLLEHYPAWAKLLFLATTLACCLSVIAFVVLYQGAEQRLSEQVVGSELSGKVAVITETVPTGVEGQKVTTSESHSSPTHFFEDSITVRPALVEPPHARDVTYVLEKADVGLKIRPAVGYLSTLDSGGPITELSFNQTPFPLVLPVIDLKVVNNSSKTVFFTNAVFEVEQSRIDSRPILLIPADDYVGNAQHIWLVNDGWGEIDDCVLHFNLVTVNEPRSYNGPFGNEVSVGAFAEDANVDISSAFERAGVNNTAIKALRWKEKSGDSITIVGDGTGEKTLSMGEYRRKQRLAFGKFTDNVAVVQGEIVFSSGGQRQKPVKFSTHVYVMEDQRTGAAAPPTAQYDAYLQAEGDHYTVDVPISQALKAGEFDRFTFRVAAPKSSLHRFQLKLLYNEGEVFSTTHVELQLFMPRSVVRMFRSASKEQGPVSQH